MAGSGSAYCYRKVDLCSYHKRPSKRSFQTAPFICAASSDTRGWKNRLPEHLKEVAEIISPQPDRRVGDRASFGFRQGRGSE